MIDLHTHILPDVDDGPRTYETALAMLAIAESDGIESVVATPHYIPGSFALPAPLVVERTKNLAAKAAEIGIRVKVLPGQEIRAGAGLVDRLHRGEILCYDPRNRYMLVEFQTSEIPAWADRLVFDLEIGDITPVLAHPERNRGVFRNPMRLYELIQKGCRTQITAGSLTGRWGRDVQDLALLLLRSRMVHTIASDAHDEKDRTPRLGEARALVEAELGAETGRALFLENPRLILEGEEFAVPDPIPVEVNPEPGVVKFFRRFFRPS